MAIERQPQHTSVLHARPRANLRHQVGGAGDTYVDFDDQVRNDVAERENKTRGTVQMTGELPTCWAAVGKNSVKCLIDTGAQMNLLRFSAAKALKITYEDYADVERRGGRVEGVVTANGSVDPFVGTAWDVPVKVGAVVTRTHFRITRNLTRSVILGAPWCAATRLNIQYNVFGRTACRILSDNGSHNAVFIGSDPPMFSSRHSVPAPDAEDSEND
ncbi:hypothetical protein BKA63DRAFT_417926 [Paraphoma chrysanthemicola]|nr:hypothetical protein BKA63DRAFT_421193 [Paraphoma chrysanthemicola]KAH7071786.1 hypothetical protein BKA63DRAFT_417926 [Paraphoma chrysanthemicola]